jgi:hypothetical protein
MSEAETKAPGIGSARLKEIIEYRAEYGRPQPRYPERVDERVQKRRFRDRGLSARTIKLLIAACIDAPERLLIITDTETKALPGIHPAALGEIVGYRAKYGSIAR